MNLYFDVILKIIPLTRLPRAFSTFDYQINEELKTSVEIGQLVKISFRNKEIFGVIFDIEKNSENEKLKCLIEIVNEIPILNKKQLHLYIQLAEIYLVSPSTFLKMALCPLQKRKLKKMILKKEKPNIKKEKPNQEYYLYNSEHEHKKLYKNLKKTTLIIVPEIWKIEEIKKYLPQKLQTKVVTWYAELSNKEKFENWLQIKKEEETIVIGTRNALFLPFNNLDKVIIDYEHDENLKSWDSSPKFQSKDIAKFLQKLYSCDLIFSSFSPSFEKYYEISKGTIKINKKMTKDRLLFKRKKINEKNLPIIINFTNKDFFKNKNIFSLELEDKIKNSKEDVFIYLNRKGYATSVTCMNCNFVESDPLTGLPLIYKKEQNILYSPYNNFIKPLSATCPKCNSELTKMYGYGTELVESELKKLLNTNTNHNIINIDKNTDLSKFSEDKQNIIIGTIAAFKSINWMKTELIVFLDIDRQLAIPEYLSTENIWHNIQEVEYYRRTDSKFYIQSNKAEHTIFKSLGEKDRIYRTDLNNRQKLGLFPYKYIVKYYYGGDNEGQSKFQIEQTIKNLNLALTKISNNVTILGPYEMQPKYFRRKYWYSFAIKIAEKNPFLVIRQINQFIPGNHKIDSNPISLLSP
ncbi:MAG: primosomal protein N' [Candidatus Magasanikbacteria bacterium CG_4_10_14_0_8_um_filter_32_14]|uniref:Primosomal protein N n=1 Tax=Candidatus Magasanikbacteria bacterium CG_4_10_14_0_8_um_filter_32_14 TaxID=1974640 RepID=A0A2M7RA57_9BACT|nr:MAG: primosomal protein N' [Candidatus Magasanikbacteria bacterium CG_4_10_14_0_8_um_filter_32_14]